MSTSRHQRHRPGHDGTVDESGYFHGQDVPLAGDRRISQTPHALNDEVHLETIGVDIGSSTSHVMFGHVQMERLSQSLSSRFVVSSRTTTWRSPIILTPYRHDETIDSEALQRFFTHCYRTAGVRPTDIDSGIVVLTGEALKRQNAEAVASLFAESSGRFVCALASHHREAAMAAMGSGAAALSRREGTVLNVDVGGGTTKFALLRDGHVERTAAIAVGARLLIRDDHRRVSFVAGPMAEIARGVGVDVSVGAHPSDADISLIVTKMVDVVADQIAGRNQQSPGRELLLTDPLPDCSSVAAITFSGGVAEYVYRREHQEFADLGRLLGEGLRAACTDGRIPIKLRHLHQGIRATAVGLSQFSLQLSGSTITVGAGVMLPLRNVPMTSLRVDFTGPWTSADVVQAVAAGVERAGAQSGPRALALRWAGPPTYRRLFALAKGLASGVAATEWDRSAEGAVFVIVIDADIGRSLGRILVHEMELNHPILCLDGVDAHDCDYLDVGELLDRSDVVPVTVKSLLFDPPSPPHESYSAVVSNPPA